MNIVIALVVGMVVGYWVGRKQPPKAAPFSKGDGQTKEKEQGKAKILEMFNSKESITNDDVEQALGTSDRSATRYLDELEKEGKVEQIGRTGRSVTYRKK